NIKDMFLVYEGDIKRELKVSCYTNAGYLTDADDLKSQTGYYIAAYDASKEAIWVRKFISRLGVVPTIEEPIEMYYDNTGSIAIANESGITKGARHFHAKVHYLREVIEYGKIKLEKVHTDDNLANPFTKALAFRKHSEHTKNIGMLPAIIKEYLVKVNKRRAFWSLNKDILKTIDSEDQYVVSIKKIRRIHAETHQKTTKETRSICRIQKKAIRRIEDIVCEDSGRYQSWSLLQETPNTSYPTLWIHRIEPTPDPINTKLKNEF
ncbi:hypothetical protein Tco_0759764, partial [Tanacetum coccineum]